MRRLGAALAAVVALGAVPVVGLAAANPADDVNGPKCLNILEGLASYDTDPGSGAATVTSLVSLETTACKRLDRYTLHILDAAGTNELATASGTQAGTQPNEVGFRYAFGASPPSAVCIYVTSDNGSTKPVDRAPDTGCVDLGLDGGSGARAFQG